MKILRCPLNGERNISEFTYGGEYHVSPDASQASPAEWAEHVFFADNKAGVVTEWWCHTASSYWFLAERDTRSDRILRTYAVDSNLREQLTPVPEKSEPDCD